LCRFGGTAGGRDISGTVKEKPQKPGFGLKFDQAMLDRYRA